MNRFWLFLGGLALIVNVFITLYVKTFYYRIVTFPPGEYTLI